MSWVAAGVASGAATMAGVKYIKGRRDAKKDAKNRPKYEIPEEAKQNLTQAQTMALQGLPEEQKQQYLTNIQRGSAQALSASQSRGGGLQGIATINQNQNDQYAALLTQDANARFRNQDVLMNQRQNMADYKDQSFQFNKINPHYEGIAQRNANQNELFQNLNNAAMMGSSGMGSMGGGGNKSQQSQGSEIGQNPYGKQTGSYTDPNTSKMFTQQNGNNYGYNVGTFNDPTAENMFKSKNQNPYYY